MANFTKNAIRASFLKLLEERPLSKITVKDITDDCGINRNSFYYHYQDVPSLMQEILADEVTRIISEYPSVDSIEDCLTIAARFAADNKRLILHIYSSANREIFEQYLWQVCEQSVNQYFDAAFPGVKLKPEDRAVLVNYHVCEAFGVVCGWLHTGMRSDMSGFLKRMCEIRKGMSAEMVKRCSEDFVLT